jgi:hypothetical protein
MPGVLPGIGRPAPAADSLAVAPSAPGSGRAASLAGASLRPAPAELPGWQQALRTLKPIVNVIDKYFFMAFPHPRVWYPDTTN